MSVAPSNSSPLTGAFLFLTWNLVDFSDIYGVLRCPGIPLTLLHNPTDLLSCQLSVELMQSASSDHHIGGGKYQGDLFITIPDGLKR